MSHDIQLNEAPTVKGLSPLHELVGTLYERRKATRSHRARQL